MPGDVAIQLTRENLLRALNAQLYLDDIREACERIMRYSQGLDLNQFVQDEKTFDAVVRNLEVIGEAAKHIPPEVRARYPDVEWNKLAGLRDIVAHKYFGLDEDIRISPDTEASLPQIFQSAPRSSPLGRASGTTMPSRRAISMTALLSSSSNWCCPTAIGSMRLSVRAATRHSRLTSSRRRSLSNRGDTTSTSISLQGSG
jgi:uncharacterized protein with HEPN domain